MSSQITSRLEINLLDATTSPQAVSKFALKNKVQAIVAAPEYVAPLIAYRATMGGRHKIISALDFPKGANYAMDKLFRANPDFVGADGFEILLSSGRSEVEIKNEMKTIYTYLKTNRPLSEIRWCLKMHTASEGEVKGILKNMKLFPPSFVRVDPHLETPRATIEQFEKQVELIKELVPYGIKISGNVDLQKFETLEGTRGVKRFDVTMKQAEKIVQELKIRAGTQNMEEEEVAPAPKLGPAVKNTGNIKRIRL